jgi:hypothetical protein
LLVRSTKQIPPSPLYLDVSLIDSPKFTNLMLVTAYLADYVKNEFEHPTLDYGVVNTDTSHLKQFFNFSAGQTGALNKAANKMIVLGNL